MSTIRDVVTRSLKLIEEVGAGQEVTGEQATDGLASLITMVDGWSIQNKLVFTETRENFSLTVNDPDYTIGSGGDFNTTVPIEIEAAFVRDASGNDTPLEIIGAEEYANIPNKSQSGIPAKMYFDGNYPLATILIWPVPNQASSIYIYSKKPLSNFSSLDDVLSVPSGYERAFIYNLAIEIAPEYGKTPSPVVIKIAGESKKALESANSTNDTVILSVDSALMTGSTWDIYSDEV